MKHHLQMVTGNVPLNAPCGALQRIKRNIEREAPRRAWLRQTAMQKAEYGSRKAASDVSNPQVSKKQARYIHKVIANVAYGRFARQVVTGVPTFHPVVLPSRLHRVWNWVIFGLRRLFRRRGV